MAAGLWLVACSAVIADTLPPAAAAPLDLQRLLDDAVAARRASVAIPPGTYRVKPSGKNPAYHLAVMGARDIEIVGSGATLVFENPKMGGIWFEHCTRMTVRGLTLDWDPLPFTQGRIVAADAALPGYDIAVDQGYSDDPELFSKGAAVEFYAPATRLLKPGTWDLFNTHVTREKPGMLRLRVQSAAQVSGNDAAVGDLAVVNLREKIGMRFMNCAAVAVEQVTFWTAPGIAVQEVGGEGGSRYTYTVTRGPSPAGRAPRLMSATADAFHSSGVRRGPVVDGCLFEYQGDDGVAIHGAYSLVVSTGECRTVHISPMYEMPYRSGDCVRVYDGRTYRLKEQAQIVAVARDAVPEGAALEPVQKLWERYHSGAVRRSYYALTLDRALSTCLGDLACSSNWTGSGFAVRNNTIRRHRARGIIVKAENGVIENNLIEDVGTAGIFLGPEFAIWLEGDYVRNVTVRSNVIRRVGMSANCMKNRNAIPVGAITVAASSPEKALPGGWGNRDLAIEGNDVDTCGGIGMLIACAQHVRVTDNRIGATRVRGQMDGAQAFGVDPDAAIYVNEARDVRFAGNRVGGKGVVMGPAVSEDAP